MPIWVLFGTGEVLQPSPPDPAPEENLYIEFQRPWFPQWQNKQEVSNPQTGYRLEGSAVNMILHGFGLDPGEIIMVENRDTLGRLVSSGTIQADGDGKFYLRVITELPDGFQAGQFYTVFYARENGAMIKAGLFYIGESPPEEYHYESWGNLTFGFSCDLAGKPYLLSWLSHRDGPNILDNYKFERGREFQGDLIDGYPHDGDSFRFNTVNPTQGGGDYGEAIPTATE